ncbi:MAG: tetratricopeptide repeat protein, partial [Planctomycetota bacterium]
MQKLNVKRVIILLVVVLALIGSGYGLHGYQIQRNASAFKNLAEAAWHDDPRRISDAVALMKSYLVLKPRDYEAMEELGFWYADCGYFPSASATLEELLKVLEKQESPDLPRIQKVRRKLIEAALAQGRCGDAVPHLKVLNVELPDDVDVWNLLGKCQVTLGREEEAIKSFTTAIGLKPDRVDIYYNKAMVLRFPPVLNVDAAEKCMAQMIAQKDNAKSAVAHHIYGMWLTELGKFDEALKQAKATLALDKDHPGGLYLAGQSELALRNFSKAQDYARQGMKVAPQDFAMYVLMADILIHNDQRDKAVEILKTGIKINEAKSSKAQLLWHLANIYLDSRGSTDAKSIAEALDCMRRMRDYKVSPIQLAFLDARVLYANDDWKAAREKFEKVRPQMTDSASLMKSLDYWIGYCYLQQGNPDQAMAAFRRSLSFDKFFFKARDSIAQIFSANGQLQNAAEEYRLAVIGSPGNTEARLAFARTLVLLNIRRSPAEQNWDEVQRVLQQAENLSPNDGQIKLLIAEMLLARGQAQQAGDLLESLQESSPKGVLFWIARANLAARRGEAEQAKKILAEAQSKLGDLVSLRLAQAPILLRELGSQAGIEIDKLAENVKAFSPAEKTSLWSGLANNLLEIKEYDRAKRLCTQIAQLQPHDATIRYRLLELALVTHDARDPAASRAELDRVLEEIDAIAGRGPLWMYGMAVGLKLAAADGKPVTLATADDKPSKLTAAPQGNLEFTPKKLLTAAMDYATQAQKLRLAWSRPHVLKGEICRQQGNDEEALQHYMQASLNGDRDLNFIRLLLQMLFERQRYQEAEQVIHRLDSNRTPLTSEIEQKKAEIFTLWGPFDRALDSASSAYNPASEDYRDHIWHGQVLKLLARRAEQEGHLDKLQDIAQSAEKSLRRACQIAPNAPECRVELVQLLVATHQKKEASIAADDAREMIPLNASPLAMGYIHEALGETQKAGQCYEKAVQLKPDLPMAVRLLADFYLRNQDIQRATPLIERLLSGTLQTSESDLVAARRMKAILLANEGYSKRKEASELIDRNLASPMASPQDKRLKIQFLLADPRQVRGPLVHELAVSLVTTGGSEPDPEDRFQLARLYQARSDWGRCREQMEKLVSGSQGNSRHLAAYVRMLLDQNQLNDAELWLDQLERVSKTAASVAFRAELLFLRKQWGKVPGFLADYIRAGSGEKGAG